MARTRRRKRSKDRAPGTQRPCGPGSPERPGDAARASLEAGRYKDAIAGFKALLKSGEREEWRQGLADAYRGRARALAEKGLLREASVIWEQLAKTCSSDIVHPEYLQSLLGSGQARRAAAIAGEHRERLQSTHGGWDVGAWLAAAALSGEAGVLEELPGEDPVVRDFAVADAALGAYCRADDALLEDALGRITFRSPYRDLRTVLKACRALAADSVDETALARRIGPDSPYRGLANVVELAARSKDDPLESLRAVDTNTRTAVHALLGLGGAEAGFLQAAARLGAAPKPKALLQLVVRHVDVLGIEPARGFASALLAHYPQGSRDFVKAFGRPSPMELSRWAALEMELDGDAYEIEEAWHKTLMVLSEEADEEANRIRAALILRRIAAQWVRHGGRDHSHIVRDLESIVALDPEDRESWLQLIEKTREARDLKAARGHLDGALNQFPDDPAVLVAAVETAIAGNAYKKAARYAARLVEVDPLNPKARRLLLAAHLDHSRKQIRGGKLAAAARELDLAAGCAGTEFERGEIALLRGMLALSDGASDAAGPLLCQALTALGGGLTGQFFLRLEVFRLRRDGGAALAAAELPRRPPEPEPAEVVHLMRTIQGLDAADDKGVRTALEEMAGPLARAARGTYSMADLELVCEALKRHGVHPLLQKYASTALRACKDRPVFVYYLVYAKGDGAMFNVGPRDHNRIERALEGARVAGDQRTAHRIESFLDSGFFPFPARVPMPPGMHGIGMDETIGPIEADMIDQMLGGEPHAQDARALAALIQMLEGGGDPMGAMERLFGGRGEKENDGRRTRRRKGDSQGDLFE